MKGNVSQFQGKTSIHSQKFHDWPCHASGKRLSCTGMYVCWKTLTDV